MKGEEAMWCVLRADPGKEQDLFEACRKEMDGRTLFDVFQFTGEQMKRYEGSWHLEKRRLFPLDIFLETLNIEELIKKMGTYAHMAQKDEQGSFIRALSTEEEQFLMKLCGKEHYLSMSRGFIKDGITHVTQGPLKGWESRICKIDRHKRTAKIKAPTEWLQQSFVAGLEIVSKS